MSKYTTEVRFICESLTGHEDSVGYDDVDSVIEEALPLIFSFDFPIFDENYREVLETKILRHYYTREIGLETYGLWKLKLQTKLNEIMPYYNKLYQTELLKYNPLYDVDMTTTNVGQRTGEKTDITTGEATTERNGSITHETSDERTRNTKNSSNAVDINKNDRMNSVTESGQDNTSRTNSANESGTDTDTRTNTFNGNRVTDNNETVVSNSKSQGNRDSQNRDMYSDTPQGNLTGVDTNTYLTNFRKVLGTDNNTETGNSTGVTQGKQNIEDSNTESSEGNKLFTNNKSESGSSTNDFSKSANTTDSQTGTNINKRDEYGQDIDTSKGKVEETNSGSDSHKNNSTAIGRSTNTEDYVLHVFGKTAGASYAKLIKEFRDNLLNIDMDIIRDLAELFMLIW